MTYYTIYGKSQKRIVNLTAIQNLYQKLNDGS